MRKVLILLAASGAALGLASPAAAQYFPGQPYGYGYNGYGYNGYGNWGQVRSLQTRIDNVERQIRRLDRRDIVRDRSADRLRAEANDIERRLHFAARNGLNPYEAQNIRVQIDRLEQRVQYATAYGYGRYHDYYGGDRWEREHERWHENHDDDDRDD